MSAGRGVAGHDLSRRRLLLVAISGLTVLATLPVIGHHVMSGGGNLLNGRDNIGNLCLVALHAILSPVHFAFHLALVAGALYALTDRARAWARLRRVIGNLGHESVPPTGPFAQALAAAGAARNDAIIVRRLPNPAFTAGWWKPKIYLAAELPQRLSGPELKALITHELAHARRRDPLRLAVLRFFACLVFWLPALRRLAEDVADEAEFEADDAAAGGKPLVLASAIINVALMGMRAPRMEAVVGFATSDLVEQRVQRLSGEPITKRSHVTTSSLRAAGMMLAVALTSGVVMAHPLSTDLGFTAAGSIGGAGHSGHTGKCGQHDGLALLHLFCGGLPLGLGTIDCPHHDATTTS